MNILLGVTGSVASTLVPKLHARLSQLGNVIIVATEKSHYFFDDPTKCYPSDRPFDKDDFIYSWDPWNPKERIPVTLFDDEGEWRLWQKKGDPVQHIDLRKWAHVFVLAPLTANTLAKMANGICDNLLTSVIRAWDYKKPMVLAPAMNTAMFEHPLTSQHIKTIQSWGDVSVVDPVEKVLACGDTGKGAMANIEDIALGIQKALQWKWPLNHCNGMPFGNHPGAFGFRRKHDVHTGVDLYVSVSRTVRAMEPGTIVKIIPFTGSKVVIEGKKLDWWNDTSAVLVEGASGVISYSEIEPDPSIAKRIGSFIPKGEVLGRVIPVLPEGKERRDIPGHSRYMLHVELYSKLYDEKRGIWESWELDKEKPELLLDPTRRLLDCKPPEVPLLEMP